MHSHIFLCAEVKLARYHFILTPAPFFTHRQGIDIQLLISLSEREQITTLSKRWTISKRKLFSWEFYSCSMKTWSGRWNASWTHPRPLSSPFTHFCILRCSTSYSITYCTLSKNSDWNALYSDFLNTDYIHFPYEVLTLWLCVLYQCLLLIKALSFLWGSASCEFSYQPILLLLLHFNLDSPVLSALSLMNYVW